MRNCLSDYRREIESHGIDRTLAIATSAVRDAENGEAFLGEIEWSYGFATQLLDGAAEAAMMARGVAAGRPALDDTLLVDIGGGSTELVACARGEVSSSTSMDVGCVRVTERFLVSDPPTPEELVAAAAAVRALLPRLERDERDRGRRHDLTLAALDLGLEEYDPERTHGHRIARAAVAEQLDRLAGMTLAERLEVPRIEPGRAPVIVAGLVILREILDTYGLDEIEASERTSSTAPHSQRPSSESPRRAWRPQVPTPAAEATQPVEAAPRRPLPPRPRRVAAGGRFERTPTRRWCSSDRDALGILGFEEAKRILGGIGPIV